MDTNDHAVPVSQPAGRSEISRITGVFIEPAATFSDIAERPRWLVPFFLGIVIGLTLILTFGQHVGWERTVRRQLESNPRTAEMPAAQRERSIQAGAKFAPIVAIGAVIVGTPIIYLIEAGVFLLILRTMLNVELRFRQMWAILCYAAMPRVLAGILSIGVMFLKSPEDFNIQNPLAFNPAAFLDPDTSSKFIYSIAGALDFFTLWYLVLIAIGIQAAARKLSFGGALLTVGIPWALLVLARATFAQFVG